jgi:TatD DNase family protein
VVGVGEIGLDYRGGTTPEEKLRQKQLFKDMVGIAAEAGKPIVVHNRNADEDIIEILKDFRGKVVMHCFTRNEEFMKRCTGQGWYISFGGLLLRENNSRMRKVATLVPNEYLLVETDAPYVTPMNVKLVAETLALLRKVDMKEIEKITDQNADRVFKCIN